jgi:hypothetical protein
MIQAFISGIEVVSNKDFTISEQMLKTSSTILNNCYPKTWETTHDYVNNFYFPKDYSPCEIYKDNNLIFDGIVKNSGDVSLRPSDPKYCSLQILDYKCLLSEGETLDFVISDKTIVQAIELVLEKCKTYSFHLGNVHLSNPNKRIKAYSTLDKTPYDVLQYLADISQARWFTRKVGNTIYVDFWESGLMGRADDIEYTTEYFEENNIVDLSFSFNTRDYRNKQTILSDKVYASIDSVETQYANGFDTLYYMTSSIGVLKDVKVNGVSKTIATRTEKEIGIYADFYYDQDNNYVESASTYTSGTRIDFTYTAIVKGRQSAINSDEVERIKSQIGGNGVIARYEKRNDILSSDELNNVAQTYLKYKGIPEVILTVQTKDKDLFNIGQKVYFDIPQIQDLCIDYMVKTKEIQITQTGNDGVVFYTYQLSSSFNAETEINYFDNQRNKSSGNIKEGDFITRNVDYISERDIYFDNLVVEELEVSDNTLENGLEMVLTK